MTRIGEKAPMCQWHLDPASLAWRECYEHALNLITGQVGEK
jgi:hypothetical protein